MNAEKNNFMDKPTGQDPTTVKNIRKRFESIRVNPEIKIPVIKPKPQSKMVLMRHESMRNSSTIDHRIGMAITNLRPIIQRSASDNKCLKSPVETDDVTNSKPQVQDKLSK